MLFNRPLWLKHHLRMAEHERRWDGGREREIRPLRAVCYCKPAVVHTRRVLLCGSRSTQQTSFTGGLIKDAYLNDKSKVISDFNTFLPSLVNVDFLKSSQIFLSESQRRAGTQSGSRKLWKVDMCMNASQFVSTWRCKYPAIKRWRRGRF